MRVLVGFPNGHSENFLGVTRVMSLDGSVLKDAREPADRGESNILFVGANVTYVLATDDEPAAIDVGIADLVRETQNKLLSARRD